MDVHIHDETCEECALEEHDHTAECVDDSYICGMEAHTHGEDCAYTEELVCGQAEHTHATDGCGTAGDYTVKGVLTFDGQGAVPVSAKLHVIPNIIDLRNISVATMADSAPTLPSTVRGVLADGTLAGEFPVVWNAPAASSYDTVGQIVTIPGTAAIFGDETMDVTCSVRVAEAINTESVNVAPQASSLSQDIPAANQSGNLDSIIDGNRNPGESTNDRWTNWGNRYNSATATLTLRWDTAQVISDLNMFYRYDNDSCRKPDQVVIRYSLDGTNFTEVGHTESALNVAVNNGAAFTYALNQVINPIAIQITFTQTGGTSGGRCVGLYELEVMTYAATFQMNSSADLSGIRVDDAPISGFSADKLAYEAQGNTVTAESAANAGITVLPIHEDVVRIITVSEDGSASKAYSVTLPQACRHLNTSTLGAYAATCTTAGFTGDTFCADCGIALAAGTVIEATGHQHTELRNVIAATCEVSGYTGDTWCADCNTKLSTGTAFASSGHRWNSGVITREPTETAEGVKTYTCTVCGGTRTEGIPRLTSKKAPSVSMSLSKTSDGKISVTGQVNDYANLENYYEITAHGLLYIHSAKIGTRLLTVSTSGRTRVNFSGYGADGSYTYSFKPTSKSTSYAMRAFITYTNPETGYSVTVYSPMIRSSYNGISG
jgi:hypothetical protein